MAAHCKLSGRDECDISFLGVGSRILHTVLLMFECKFGASTSDFCNPKVGLSTV